MSLVWSYGITTVPNRFETTLPKTITSLKNAGFDKPRLFVDQHEVETYTTTYDQVGLGELLQHPITAHDPPLLPFGNWLLALYELFIRNPYADRYALFQDDMITYCNLIKYLEHCPYPSNGYLNLYTFPVNLSPQTKGWYRPLKRGQGAVALVFDNKTVKALLTSSDIPIRIQDKKRGATGIDGVVHDNLSKLGIHEYVHNPSLVQHIGLESTIHPKHHNQEQANTFLGEDFDATQLCSVPQSPVSDDKYKVGLVGYLADTSLGRLNSDVIAHLKVDRWLAKPHKGATIDITSRLDILIDPIGVKLEKFVRLSDVIIFCGRSPYGAVLFDYCKKYNRKVVCIKTPESLDGQQGIDLLLDKPEAWTFETIQDYNNKIKELI